MNRLLIFVAFFAVLCSACSVPARIDATTDDKFEQSLDHVRASLPEDRRQTFDASLSTISTIVESGIDFTDVGVGVESMRAAVRRALNGKTGEEIIAYAEDLKRGAQHVPQVATSNHNATDDSQRPPLVVGDSVDMSGNSFGCSVSAKFGETELRRLHAVLNGPTAKTKLQSYVCRSPVPAFKITVVLWYEGPYQERQVRMQMTPPLYKADAQIEAGIGYLFEHSINTLDTGPPIDYGYHRPLDGSPITPAHFDGYPEPKVANCGPTDAQAQ